MSDPSLVHRVGWEISNAAVEEMRSQGFSGGWDHDALANSIAAAAIRASGADEMRAVLQHYAATYCEGWCTQVDRPSHLDCGGCLARSTLARIEAGTATDAAGGMARRARAGIAPNNNAQNPSQPTPGTPS